MNLQQHEDRISLLEKVIEYLTGKPLHVHESEVGRAATGDSQVSNGRLENLESQVAQHEKEIQEIKGK